jgi:iron complex transport system permease protein
MSHRINTKALLSVLIIVSIISLILCIGIGPVYVGPLKIAKILLGKIPELGKFIARSWTPTEEDIIFTVRLPRVLLGFSVGCALAFSGKAMQVLVRNELADPYILGVSYGAAAFSTIGVLLGTFSFLGVYALAANGCLGAIVSLTFVFIYALNKGKVNIDQLLMGGIAIALFMKAVVKILVMTNVQAFMHNNTAFWTSGGLAGTRWPYLTWPLLIIAICFFIMLINYRALNALLFGEDTAQTLGINVKKMQRLLIILTSIMIGMTVSVSGGIGFVGLVAPHVARMLVGGNHKRVFPISSFMGGIFVLWADVGARMLFAPEELSVGIITAIVGGPCFIYLLKRKVPHSLANSSD